MVKNETNYSTYLGGAGADDEGNGIAADANGAVYVTGETQSTSFPTQLPYQGSLGNATGDAFVTKIVMPTVQLSATTQTVSEGVGQATVSATLSAASTYTVTVGIATSNGTAVAGSDYAAIATTLVFAPGATTASVQIPIINDSSDETNETFVASLSNPFNAVFGTQTSQTLTITDDDPPPTINWQNSAISVNEAGGMASVTVQLSAPSSFPVTVGYATTNGTATAGADYISSSGAYTFQPGESIKVINLLISNDTTAESNETFTISLGGPTNGTLGTPSTATITIIDDDTTATPSDVRTVYDRNGNRSLLGSTTTYGTQSASCSAGALTKPHAVTTFGSTSYCYDANGNMVSSSAGRSVTWNADNQPINLTNGSVTETYTYDADGERVSRVNGSVTTIYLGGVWEEPVASGVAGTPRLLYTFNGQVIAQSENTVVSYLFGDHLGSISLVTSAFGVELSRQSFDPWGQVRSGGVSQTSLNYTGQRRDDTGLLFYHARYYDPALGRFLSPDTVIPGNASGSMDGIALRPLTVDFHESKFVAQIAQENQKAFWFQLSSKDKKQAGSPFGPMNPQALDRYSYVQNNPVKGTDPTGHSKRKVGNEDASYDNVCSKGNNLVDCDTPESSIVTNEHGDVLEKVCVKGQCQYIWSGTGLFQDFARRVDSIMSNAANLLIALASAGVSLTAGAASCIETAGIGCVLGLIGGGVADAFYFYYVYAYEADAEEANYIYNNIVSYNRRYNKKYP